MAEQAEKDTTERSIRTVQTYSNNDQFQQESMEQIIGRRNHLSTSWNRFAYNHVRLLPVAADQAAIDDLNRIYDEVEIIYLQTSAKLKERCEELKRQIDQNNQAAPIQNDILNEGNAANNANARNNQVPLQQTNAEQLQQQLQPIIVQLNNARPVI